MSLIENNEDYRSTSMFWELLISKDYATIIVE
jgi:hypothetical protein